MTANLLISRGRSHLWYMLESARDNVLMSMVIHLNEVTERNFIVSLDPREYADEKLVCCLGWRQG